MEGCFLLATTGAAFFLYHTQQKDFIPIKQFNSMNAKTDKVEAFARLLDVLDTLRVQCPWDREQTNETLRANTIEEVYELSEALIQKDIFNTKKELGDVLLHILFYARIAQEQGAYDIADVCNTLCNKLIFRHPHVYGESNVKSSDAVTQQWEQIKQKEKDGNKTVLSGVPTALPSVVKAYRIQDKARAVGFDWEEPSQVWDKVSEEIQEVQQAIRSSDPATIEEEFGDLLFAVINAARLYNVNPDNALEQTNRKFIDRFGYIETVARERGKDIKQLTFEEMETLWCEAKKK
ncbi:XTP/dITP diphosphohydrolase [Porphyromonas circumdentaria]|uniref:Nucleoside triphosphate pyrophosphohydrolase n=2 Tax=Porphyromonas circumdentaria TaxID=29524 RepID=A0A1T4N517_9PORP|nr:XTP/dITP diphosphohydrolase [Porphyromonas circumdentaria]